MQQASRRGFLVGSRVRRLRCGSLVGTVVAFEPHGLVCQLDGAETFVPYAEAYRARHPRPPEVPTLTDNAIRDVLARQLARFLIDSEPVALAVILRNPRCPVARNDDEHPHAYRARVGRLLNRASKMGLVKAQRTDSGYVYSATPAAAEVADELPPTSPVVTELPSTQAPVTS